MKWISIKDRLPELIHRGKENPSSDDVLVTDGTNIQFGVRWICGENEYFLPYYRDFNKITHWMPLPEQPRK